MDADKRIVKQIQAGNTEVFGRLVVKYQDKILYLIYDYIDDYESAKDLAQEVFMKAFQSINTFKGDSKFSTWLYRIAVNKTIDYKRKRSLQLRPDLDSQVDDVSSKIEKRVENDDIKGSVEQYLTKLSAQQQTAIILRYFHDASIREIAETMDCKENTVRIHLLRALEKIKFYLNE
jgi:RNA polymerase sigma-70 factor (ECF subfamily)